jgi:hypothetical protein
LTIGFEYNGQPLRISMVIGSRMFDPMIPIVACCRTPVLEVVFEERPSRQFSMGVTMETTVGMVYTAIMEKYPDLASFHLHFNKKLDKSAKVADVNPCLEEPFVVKHLKLRVDRSNYMIRMTYADWEIAWPIGTPTASVIAAKAFVSPLLQASPESLSLSRRGTILRYKDLLEPSYVYAIHIPQQNISIAIRLWPMGNDNYTQKLCQMLHFDASLVKTVGDLANVLVKQYVFSNDPPIMFRNENRSAFDLDPQSPLRATDQDVLLLEYRGPVLPVQYRFVGCAPAALMEVDSDMTVAQVKLRLLKLLCRPRTLPGALQLRFWGTELCDSDRFYEYGIPAGNAIEVRECGARLTDVQVCSVPYWFAESDTVGNLELAIRAERDGAAGDFILQHHSAEVSPDQLISSLDDLELEVVEFFSIQAADGAISIPLPRSATVARGARGSRTTSG